MQIHRRLILIPFVLVALLAGCGGGGDDGDVPGSAVASVNGELVTRAEFNQVMAQARSNYKRQNRKFPAAGSDDYVRLRDSVVDFLVRRSQFEQRAAELDIEITDDKVEQRLKDLKQQFYQGNEKKYLDAIKAQGVTEDQVKKDLRFQLLQQELFKEITDGVKISDEEAKAYYNKNKSQYGVAQSRVVRHILVKERAKAQQLADQARGGASFAALAKANSTDTVSAKKGGELEIQKGGTVAPFEKVAFALDKGQISNPVKTQYGWHVIQAVSAVKPPRTDPFARVKANIKQQLLQQKKEDAVNKWSKDVQADFKPKTHYQVGFTPQAQQPTEAQTG